MTNQDLFEALRGLDHDLIEAAAPMVRKKELSAPLFLKWISLAASILTLFVMLPLSLLWISRRAEMPPIESGWNGSSNESEWGGAPSESASFPCPNDTDAEITTPPMEEAPILLGEILTGTQENAIVNGKIEGNNSAESDMIPPGFLMHTVVEAQVIEVLPDTYYIHSSSQNYRVARLRVLDCIRGDGIPNELYLLYPFYDAHVFDSYDTLIFSLVQVGIENYMMVGKESRTVQYFPNMFEVSVTRDLGYGSVIAFRDGIVDPTLWERCNEFTTATYLIDDPGWHYPASRGSTADEVKENIRTMMQENQGWSGSDFGYDYVTIADVFLTDEQKMLIPYLTPSKGNSFRQSISIYEDRVAVTYERYVNGFAAGEQIRLNFGDVGEIITAESTYTAEEIARMPDIGRVVAALDLSALKPSHIDLTKTAGLLSCYASGAYRKVDGKLYGIVKVIWTYRCAEEYTYIRDDCYFLYDESGNGRQVERSELKELLGDAAIGVIASFNYLPFSVEWE